MEPRICWQSDATGRLFSRRPVPSIGVGGPFGEQRLVGDRWEHLAAAVAAAVGVGVDEPGYLAAGLVLGGEASSGEQLMPEGRVPALGRGVVQRGADPTH